MTEEKLYEAFGELIYAVAKADGLIQDEEVSALKKILESKEWAADVQWSFDYEKEKNYSLENVYEKAMDTFQEYGPTPLYNNLIEILEEVARASEGIDKDEKRIIDNFQVDLKERLIKNLEAGNLKIG